jgi:hypothetical protein
VALLEIHSRRSVCKAEPKAVFCGFKRHELSHYALDGTLSDGVWKTRTTEQPAQGNPSVEIESGDVIPSTVVLGLASMLQDATGALK